MPRRRPRFKRLDEQLRNAGGEVRADSRLGRYKEFKNGDRKIEVNQTLTAEQRKRYGWGVLPFNKSLPDATPAPVDYYVASITAYSNSGRASGSLTLTDKQLGYASITSSTKIDAGFYPALLKVFVKDNATSAAVEKTSSITGETYKRHPGRSYSLPFGRTIEDLIGFTLSNVGEENVKKQLQSAARAFDAVGGISYEPEVFRPGRPILESPS